MIVSYVVGFMGMIKDSIENRILSWGLFLTSLTLLGVSNLIPLTAGNDIVSVLVRFSVGLGIVFIIIGFSSWIVTFLEGRISLIVGQETQELEKTRKKVTLRVAYTSVGIFVATFLVSLILAKFIGMF
jgi:hypothetical protein